jgi:isopenicillin-N N-acyltransferase like protein
MSYPVVTIAGDARSRGRQYGEQARERVGRSVAAYREVFREVAGLGWDEARAQAVAYVEPIRAFAPYAIDEMAGVAEGAGVDFSDVLAINTRTEVMYAAKARRARGECTAFAALAGATADGHVLVGQNWDWLPHAAETVVILRAEPDDGPAFVSVVEAGLLAKTGLNEHGVGVATNALVSDRDVGAPGVPYHVVLRSLMTARTPTDALALLQGPWRSSSANYLIAHRDGQAVDVEAVPGGFEGLALLFPDERGVLLHANHFVSDLPGTAVSRWAMPSSPFRADRLARLIAPDVGRLTPALLGAALGDHAGEPNGVCCHPDPAEAWWDQGLTVVSVIMDVTAGRIWVAHGSPCTVPFEEVAVGQAIASSSVAMP